ncbi:MAG: choice-of-anchor J domain-containing protein, partial [Clostridia bacterium]|nr:choice-of-anchor J domain-containing protein [Clostridia bacterium]
MTKKLLSLLVAALMVLTLLPVSAMAAGRLDVKGSSLPAMRSVSNRIYRAQTTVYSADFESEPADWTFVDSDGDGYNWAWDFRASGDTNSHCTPHTDSGLITSQSYVNNVGPLTPDNYAWSPSFTVPSTQLTYATFWYAGQDTSYFAEVFKVYLKVNGSNVAISDDITASGNYQQFSADISAYAGQSVQLGIRHYNVTDMFYLNIDDVLVFNTDEGYTPPVTVPEPVIPPDNLTLVYSNYYEEEADIENYSIYDADGDGDNWGWSNSESNASFAYEGIGFMFSASYGDSGALTPDNWLIDMNEFAIPSTGGYVSIYASGYDASYCAEHFGLVVGTVDAWTNEESEDFLYYVNSANGIPYETGRNYEQYWFDLTDFAGETVYAAIRHFDCTDQLYLFVDQLQYWTVDEVAPATHTVTFVDGLTNEPIATVEVEDGAAATAPDAPVHEGYTFTGWDVDFSNVTADLTVTAQYTIN